VHGFGSEPALPVDVLVVSGSSRDRPGLARAHRSGVITPFDYGEHKSGIRVTSPARAILDSGDYLTPFQLEGLIADALKAKAVTHAELEALLNRAGRRKAAKRLALALEDSPGITRSTAERMLRRLLKEAGIEQPVTDHPIGPYFADFAWVAARVVVEFDSWSYHSGKPEFFNDRDRLSYIASKGWNILPVTWKQLTDRPTETAARIASAIAIGDYLRSNRM
jgi:very-short-patch-repair endonuclease